ncbi:sensor domain-containing diguanylate cyclase [Motilimonas pumila]|uniref:diguanylate cyclase n=1 Tax=Motilimonas pumila TaxID=2303987 RepID=A0A418YET8_9GAMM|nr:diguanylate cyclase [Motilimonas pumila]RJG47706.1 sensor domain-containing diguanylate cyclase [Motilimonas pumila]
MNTGFDLKEFHWMVEMVQTIDVGLVVLDREYKIQAWNGFMENHSGKGASKVQNANMFDAFEELPADWMMHKIQSVFMLKNRAFTTWEQRPHIFKFKNYRPITGTAEFMYQNMTIIPLLNLNGEVSHVSLIIYDVTDSAVNKLQLKDVNDQLKDLSRIDALTQLFNRGHWESQFSQEFIRYKRTEQATSLVIFDIDHFKKVNDTYGHQAGDKVIQAVSQCVRDNLRESDVAGRYGGEEFTVYLVDTQADHAKVFAERLRQGIEQLVVHHDGTAINFTVSLGVAEVNKTMKTHKEWLEAADQALYKAKETGRNQVCMAK